MSVPGSIPEVVAPFVGQLTSGLSAVLGEDLVGLYVYGSLLSPDFVASRSDVDCIAVLERPLTDHSFVRLEEWLAALRESDPWTTRLQLSFLTAGKLLDDDPSACLCQFGILRRSGSDGNPIIWLDCLQRGATILGPPTDSLVPPITSDVLHQALVREVDYLDDEIRRKPSSQWRTSTTYLAYAVLTLCRILYSEATGSLTSKPRAAQWAREKLPRTFHVIVDQAAVIDRGVESEPPDIGTIATFVDHVRTVLWHRSRNRPGGAV